MTDDCEQLRERAAAYSEPQAAEWLTTMLDRDASREDRIHAMILLREFKAIMVRMLREIAYNPKSDDDACTSAIGQLGKLGADIRN